MVKDYPDEKSLEVALNTLQFYGKPIVVVKGQVFSILNIQIYYQSVFGIDQKEVIQKADNKYYITNYGNGGSDVDVNIGNVQVATFDGVGGYVMSTGISNQVYVEFNIILINYVHIDNSAIMSQSTDYRFFINASKNVVCRVRLETGLYLNLTFTNTIVDPSYYKINIKMDYNAKSITVNETSKTVSGFFNNFDNFTFGVGTTYAYPTLKVALWEAVGFFKYNFQAQQGTNIHDNSGNGNDGTLIFNTNLPAEIQDDIDDFWANKSDYAEPVRYTKGYEKFESDTVAGQYLYRLFINGSAVGTPITGYTKIGEYEPFAGVTPSEELLLQPDDTALNIIYDTYPALSVLKNPNKFDYDILNAIDLTGIDTDDFIITKAPDGIKEMKTKKSTYGVH